MRIVLQYSDKSKKTISYPKYIMECYLKRYLNEEETVDHIDGNPKCRTRQRRACC